MSDQNIKDIVNSRFKEYNMVSESFPLSLYNGTKINSVVATCSRCKKIITDSMFRGEVHPSPGHSFKVTAIGWCLNCSLLSPFLFSLVPDETGYIIRNMEYRGWYEMFEKNNVISFEKYRQKIQKRKQKRLT